MHKFNLLIIAFLALAVVGCGDDTPEGFVGDCDGGGQDEVCAVFALVNMERSNAGAAPLVYDSALALAAQRHAVDMAEQDYFSHDSLDGRNFSTRADEADYTGFPSGENIAFGQRSADEVMTSWMNSSGHRRNILSEGSNEIGVGLHESRWVQVFGNR